MRLWVVWNENKYLYLHTDKQKMQYGQNGY